MNNLYRDFSYTPAARSTRLPVSTRFLIIGVWTWSCVEIPWELAGETDGMRVSAVWSGKVLLSAIAFSTLRGSRIGSMSLIFLCFASVLALSVALPDEYRLWRGGFYLSLVECCLKLITGLTLALFRLRVRNIS
jgi:hypothetical protein